MKEDIITGIRNMNIKKWASANKIDGRFAAVLADMIEEPDETPYLLKTLTEGFKKLKKPGKNEVRDALIRIQIYCSIHGNSDPIKLSKRLFVAQTIERLLFGTNILLTEGFEEEEPEKKGKK